MTPEERDARRDLRAVAVEIAEADVLSDPWWDLVLALDLDQPVHELREIVDVVSFDRPPNDRNLEKVRDLLDTLDNPKGDSHESQ